MPHVMRHGATAPGVLGHHLPEILDAHTRVGWFDFGCTAANLGLGQQLLDEVAAADLWEACLLTDAACNCFDIT